MVNLLRHVGTREKFLLDDYPTLLVPLFVFAIMQKVFSDITNRAANTVLQSIGRNFGQQFMIFLKKKGGSTMRSYALLLSQLSFFGLGEFSLIRYTNKETIIKNTHNPVS